MNEKKKGDQEINVTLRSQKTGFLAHGNCSMPQIESYEKFYSRLFSMNISRKCGYEGTSIKTRIETIVCKENKKVFLCYEGTSIKTRIETKLLI